MKTQSLKSMDSSFDDKNLNNTKEEKDNKPSIKILVGYHKPAVLLKDEILTPIHLGRALATEASKDGKLSQEDYEWLCENMIGDDTGDNISHLNRYFCELTGIYWAYKNYDKLGNPDYIGFMHYRRQFVFDESLKVPAKVPPENYFPGYYRYYRYYRYYTNPFLLKDFKKYDLIIPEIYDVRKNIAQSPSIIKDLVIYCDYPYILKEFETYIKNTEKFKDYIPFVEDYANQHKYYFCNMFVMRKEHFFKYCEFLFEILFHFYHLYEKRLKKSTRQGSLRTLAWFSEHVTSIFFRKMIKDGISCKKLLPSFIDDTIDPKLLEDLQDRKIKNLSKDKNLLSFDLFDTLLLRTYLNPSDLFFHLEENFKLKGFAKTRLQAEQKAAVILNKTNVSFDEIYDFIPQSYKVMKEKERDLELKNIYVNPYFKRLFEYFLKEGKRVIFTTDMYYDEDFFKELFKKNDIKGYYKLYISAKLDKSKHQGSMYEFIAKDLGVKADEILHIGDNYFVDYRQALCSGFSAIHIEAPKWAFFKAFPALKSFYDNNANLSSSIIIGLLIRKWLHSDKNIEDYWEYFGYFYGAPLCYGLSKFLHQELLSSKLKEIIFVARDGYIIEKIFNLLQENFNSNIKTKYVYANRLIYDICFFKDNIKENKKDRLRNLIVSASKEISSLLNVNLKKISSKKLERILNDNFKDLEDFSKKVLKSYKEYLNSFELQEERLAFFDIATVSASSYNLLSKIYPQKQIFSYYLMVMPHFKYKKNFISYKENASHYIFDDLLEFIISAPSFPIKELKSDFSLVFDDNHFERHRKRIYENLSRYELNFTEDLLSIFKEYEVSFCADTLLNLIGNFTQNVNTEDRHYFSKIYHSHSGDFKDYEALKIEQNIQHNYAHYEANSGFSGAVSLIKTHLSYKLGDEILKIKKNKLRAFILPFSLLIICLKHFLSRNLNKILLDTNPNLKKLPLSAYNDYQQALIIKDKYLTYRLGNLLVKHPFTFLFRVKKVYKEWKRENDKQ